MSINSPDNDNAELIYHCGVAIGVNYTDSATWIWHSENDRVEDAMENYFGMQTSGLEWKSSYSSSIWINMLKADIDASRPIYYAAVDEIREAAHAWVIDGYNSNNYFHCNWGWTNGSNENAFYSLSSLNPLTYNFTSYHLAIFGAEPILDACSGLEGISNICYPDTIQYSVTIPSLARVQWSLDNNKLTQIGGNTSSTYYVRSTDSSVNGNCTITATIKNSHGYPFLTRQKQVWAGIPSTPTTDPTGNPAYQMRDGDIILITVSSAPGASSSSYYWDVSGSITTIGMNPSYGCAVETVGLGDGYFSVYSSNQCGNSPEYGGAVYVNQFLRLMVTPNPSVNETTVSIESTSAKNVFNETAGWELEVYDPSQLLKEKKTNLKVKEAKINTQNWNEGVYILRAKYKNEILQGKLIVKK
jgi:hypothetical protein